MPQINGSSIELQIGAGSTKVAKSVSCSLTTANDLPDSTTKDSAGFLEVIYGLRSAAIDADFLSNYDESINFETFATYVLTKELIQFKYTDDTIEVSGSCYVRDVTEVAELENTARYSVELVVTGALTVTELNNEFLLLEDGSFLLLEDGGKIILEGDFVATGTFDDTFDETFF